MDIETFNPATASPADTLAAQKLLAACGYYKGKIDGQFWGVSKDALRRYKQDHHPAAAAVPQHASGLLDAIFAVSKPDVGLYEVQSNRTWAMQITGDRTRGMIFRANLEKEDWQAPWSYCAGAVKSWTHQAYVRAGLDFTAMGKILTLGCVETFENAKRAGLTTSTPAPGYIGVMQHDDSDEGHMWLTRAVGAGIVLTREANTTPAPTDDPHADRNGGCVTDKSRVLSLARTPGLHILGWIRLPV